ncbi:MAG TPA: hypothetical protein VKA26_02240 [Ignavibacteriaceae bacterium]|nr:hypothetical protein [Ignavibacteriaceae bacterium]
MRDIKYTLKIFIIIAILVSGCDKITQVNPNLDYKEYIVVRSELRSGESFSGVSFTKTLPVDEQYSISKAELKNVEGYIKVNGIQIVPLHYTMNGIYMPIDRLPIKPDTTYELFAKIGNTSIYSITRIPERPKILSSNYYNNTYLEATVEAKSNEVYGAAWSILNDATAPDFQEIVRSETPDFNSVITVRTQDLPDQYKSSSYTNRRYIKVFAFDVPYQNYFKTRNNNQPLNDAFSQGGDQVIWNVQGENVIGMFIGIATGDSVRVQ